MATGVTAIGTGGERLSPKRKKTAPSRKKMGK